MSSNMGVGHGSSHTLDGSNDGGGGGNRGSIGVGSGNDGGGGGNRGSIGVGSVGIVVVGVVVARVGTEVVIEGVVSIGAGSVGVVTIMSIVVSISVSLSISLGLSLSLPLDQGGGHVTESTSGGPSEESRLGSAASRGDTVVRVESHGGESGGGGNSSDNRGRGEGPDQRGVMEEGGGDDLSVDNSGSLDHRLDNWGLGNSGHWGSQGGVVEDWGSNGEGVKSSHSRGSNGGGGGSKGDGSRDSLADGVNKPVLVQVLRESVKGDRLETTGGSDSISEGGGQRSKLGISLGLSLVQTVDRLVTVAGEGAGISRGGVVVQRIGFRLSQAERGYGENYDHALHFC